MSTNAKAKISKATEKYQWAQTPEAITVYIPIKGVLLKNIDIFYSDCMLKINAVSIKYLCIIDFLYRIDYTHVSNKFQLIDGALECFLIKQNPGQNWETLEVEGLSKQEINKRRADTQARYYAREEQDLQKAKDTKLKLDKESIDQQMYIEKHQRKTIKKARQAQHDEAQNEIFKDIDDINKLDSELTKGGVNASQKIKEHAQKKKATEASVADAQDDVNKDIAKAYNKTIKEDIFGDDDVTGAPTVTKYDKNEQIGQCTVEEIEEEEEEQIEEQEPVIEDAEETPAPPELPAVRQKKDVTMDFTEKKFAHLPARESHFKEAPYPKSKKVEKDPNDVYIDVEDKDPLWLKDKGDHFYKRNDFHSAINAYTKSIKNDKDFLMARINRGTTFMAMRAFQAAIDDFTDIENMINALPDKEREEDNEYYTKMMGRVHLKRGAAYTWISQFDAAIQDIENAMKFKGLYKETEIKSMELDIEAIKRRKESQQVKLNGDIYFARNMLNESMDEYLKALELDPMNEYAHSNIGVIYLKRQDYKNCEKFSTQALDIIAAFHSDTVEFQKDNLLEVKNLQRRSKCYEVQEDYEKAKADLDRAMLLDRENPAVRLAQKKVQEKLNTISFEKYRETANNFLKEKKFVEAMEYYDKCLRITRKATTLDNVAIYVNKIACLLSVQKYGLVVTESNDALRLIKNYKNKHDGKHSPEDIKRMASMDLRLAVRKGNALAKLGKVSEAIAEYQRALTLDPQNETIKKDLALLQSAND